MLHSSAKSLKVPPWFLRRLLFSRLADRSFPSFLSRHVVAACKRARFLLLKRESDGATTKGPASYFDGSPFLYPHSGGLPASRFFGGFSCGRSFRSASHFLSCDFRSFDSFYPQALTAVPRTSTSGRIVCSTQLLLLCTPLSDDGHRVKPRTAGRFLLESK